MVKLSQRLAAAVPYVRPGHLAADIGTDHAYLPIYLCQTGRLSPVELPDGKKICAIASDINSGPVTRASIHVAGAGLTDSIMTVRTPGLEGLDVYQPTDIILFGMGGELIASILDGAPAFHRPGIRLIMQPMTHPEALRYWLLTHGFDITDQTLCREDRRIYQIICADYRGPDGIDLPDGAALTVGWGYKPEQRELFGDLLAHCIDVNRRAAEEKERAGHDASKERTLVRQFIAMAGGKS